MIKFGIVTVSAVILAGIVGFAAAPVRAEDMVKTIVIKDHKFEPSEVEIPAGVKIRLVVKNEDALPEEFESKQLKLEKVIAGKTEGILVIGPLKPGIYKFVGEFNEKTAKGQIVVK